MAIKTLVTADDFGFTKNINRAIFEAYEKSRVTELSLMIDSYGTDEAVKYIHHNKVQNVGLHFSLLRVSNGVKIMTIYWRTGPKNNWSTLSTKR